MYKIKNRRNATDTEFPIDKALKKDYNERGILPKNENAFNDDALANFALDYLYADANKSKTLDFLKNNGFPSAQDRRLNKALYGEQEERNHMLGMLKDKTNSILNPKLPNETDRAFLRGLMGEKEGEQDYQKQISDANRALQDLQDAFRGTELERGLKPAVPISGAAEQIKRTIHHKPDIEEAIAQHSDNKKDSSFLNIAYNDGKTVAAYGANKSASQEKTSDYDEFCLTGHKSVYNRLVKLGNAWLNTTDESVRNEIHAEADLLRGLARVYISHGELTAFSAVDALNNVLKNNDAIYKASEVSGIPAAMIASALYRESLFHDPLDNPIAEGFIYSVRGDASFGIGQVRTKTAIEAENAFYEAHGMVAPNRTQEEMKARLQKDDSTNILYVAFVLWHCGQKENINITQNYNYAHADDVFQMYNPGSKGHGKKVGNYVNAFYNYYEAVGK